MLFETARRAFNDGIGNFKGIVDSRNELNQQNWDTQKEVNTDQFLDRLAQYKTPEELAAAQASGQLDALKAQFGGQIDRDAVRGAEQAQADVLMKRIAAQNQYSDDKINRDARPDIDHFYDLVGQGRLKEAAQWKANKQLGVDESSLTNVLLDRNDKQFSQNMEQARFAIQKEQERRANYDWNDKVSETAQRRLAIDLGDQALNGADSYATARSNYLKTAQEKGLRDDVVNAGLDVLQKSFQTRYGLTPEQDAVVNASKDVADSRKMVELHQQDLERSRYNNVKNWQITEDEAIASVIPRVKGEEDNTINAIRDQIAAFRSQHKSYDGVNIGPAVEQTLRSMGKDEAFWGDDKLDLTGFQEQLAKNIKEMDDYGVKKKELSKAEKKAAAKLAEARLRAIQGNILR